MHLNVSSLFPSSLEYLCRYSEFQTVTFQLELKKFCSSLRKGSSLRKLFIYSLQSQSQSPLSKQKSQSSLWSKGKIAYLHGAQHAQLHQPIAPLGRGFTLNMHAVFLYRISLIVKTIRCHEFWIAHVTVLIVCRVQKYNTTV